MVQCAQRTLLSCFSLFERDTNGRSLSGWNDALFAGRFSVDTASVQGDLVEISSQPECRWVSQEPPPFLISQAPRESPSANARKPGPFVLLFAQLKHMECYRFVDPTPVPVTHAKPQPSGGGRFDLFLFGKLPISYTFAPFWDRRR